MCYPSLHRIRGLHRTAQNLGAVVSNPGRQVPGASSCPASSTQGGGRARRQRSRRSHCTGAPVRAGPDPAQAAVQRAAGAGLRGYSRGAARSGRTLDASDIADVCIDTSGAVGGRRGGPRAEALRRMAQTARARAAQARAGSSGLIEPERRLRAAAPPILWILRRYGASASRPSVLRSISGSCGPGSTAANVDLDQVGVPPPGERVATPRNHRLKARNLAGHVADLPRSRGSVPDRGWPGRGRGRDLGVHRRPSPSLPRSRYAGPPRRT